jgi:hypothetical protein
MQGDIMPKSIWCSVSNRKVWKLLLLAVVTVMTVACIPTEKQAPSLTKKVFVLLINPQSQNEGIYTISYQNTQQVLMFESEEEVARYNDLLKKQNFGGLVVEEINQWEIEAYCKTQRYECKLIKKGTQVVPPQENAPTDFLPKAK